ncbi:MAG: hypothetical protein ACJ751_16650, partial [Niastella sp.]|uniref:hypothetical protein n=1 Tax=Niastella sp. TaxID=1869183 RepID=UPI003899F2B7
MIRNSLVVLLILSFSTTSLIYAQEATIRQKLAGSWLYFGLEFSEPLSASDKLESEKGDRMNKDLIITFEADGKYIVWKKQIGKTKPYAKGILSLTNKGRHLKITGLEGDID